MEGRSAYALTRLRRDESAYALRRLQDKVLGIFLRDLI